MEMDALPDLGLSWLEGSGEHAEIALSTRVRLARNLQGHAFGPRARVNDRESVLNQVRGGIEASELLRDGMQIALPDMDVLSRRVLLERRIVTKELIGDGDAVPARGASVVLSDRAPVSVLVNEEDHLRLQAFLPGLQLRETWGLVDRLDEELGSILPYAFHPEFGFLTSCPTNVGTGLRASVLLHLPGLVLTKEISRVLHSLGQVGLTFRGLYGEGSEVVGNFFQISNQTTLGKSEDDLVDHLNEMVREVIRHELQARQILLRDARAVTEDKIWRAYGLLLYARTLSFEELMNLLSGVRLGMSLQLLPEVRVYTLNKLMVFTQAAHLEQAAGRDLTPTERDAHRAAYVRQVLSRDSQTPTGDPAGPDSPSPTPDGDA
jgi:protein arginine kinase